MRCPYKVKICTKCKKILIACKKNFHKDKKGKYGFTSYCKKCKNEYIKQRYNKQKEKILEYQKQYRETHKEKILEYREAHKEKILEYQKQYFKKNPHIPFNSISKRRFLEENQGRGITKEQWLEMMLWFNFCCAYSGKVLGNDEKNKTIDHIISLSVGGLNEPWNCVPIYKSYNCKKQTKNMEDWYRQQDFFSEERLEKIYAWCEYAWNKWGV